MEALPIFFDKIVPPAFAILISVVFIVFGGEILPQAICTGPNQLAIAERLTPIIKVCKAFIQKLGTYVYYLPMYISIGHYFRQTFWVT
jgi:metal transporter CNNM